MPWATIDHVILRWERVSRIPRPPGWASALVGVWLLLVLAGVVLERWVQTAQETCLLHRLTGHACPTCGSTRVVIEFMQGGLAQAFHWNPLVAAGLLLGAGWLVVRLAAGRVPDLTCSPRERHLLLLLGLALLLGNWAHVLRTQG